MKIAIIGYGKMGRAIEALALEAGHEVILRITAENTAELTAENLKKANVAVEFTRPETTVSHLLLCFQCGVPVVSGTTGWLDELPRVLQAREEHNGGFFYASNFSIGVNITFAVSRVLARLMQDQTSYEVAMEEVHHTQKLDAPSGTAITLAKDILQEIKRKTSWVNRAEHEEQELPIVSRRIEGVPGTHEIRYTSDVDTITLRHEAHSREGFARGALKAAEWMMGKSGYFGMSDLLGF